MSRFQDRTDAGWQLARKLSFLKGRDDVVVMAMAYGGVPVAYEIALSIRAPLDVLKVKKLLVPGSEELAIGAVAPGGIRVLDTILVQDMALSSQEIQDLAATAGEAVEREQQEFRKDHPGVDVAGKQVVLVDDGIATGLTIHVAARRLKALGAAKILVAVPVIPESSLAEVRAEVDAVVFLATPEPFCGVANWYYDFTPVPDVEVKKLLHIVRDLGPPPVSVKGSQDLAL